MTLADEERFVYEKTLKTGQFFVKFVRSMSRFQFLMGNTRSEALIRLKKENGILGHIFPQASTKRDTNEQSNGTIL